MKAALWIIAGLVAIFFAVGFSASSTPEGQEKARQRRAIEACWDDQKRKSNTPSDARFIAGACEGMESDFLKVHGVKP